MLTDCNNLDYLCTNKPFKLIWVVSRSPKAVGKVCLIQLTYKEHQILTTFFGDIPSTKLLFIDRTIYIVGFRRPSML